MKGKQAFNHNKILKLDLQVIQNKIFEVRGCRVMLDFHLAELYQVETRALKQAVKRNIGRSQHRSFPVRLYVCPLERGSQLIVIHRGITKCDTL